MTIHIEIAKSYNKKKWKIRIGDISGGTESYNISQEEVLEEIKEAMESKLSKSEQVKK